MTTMKFLELCECLEKIEAISSRNEMTLLLADLFKNLNLSEADKTIYLLQGKLLPDYYGIDFGLGEKLVMQALSVSTGFSQKEINEIYSKLGDLGSTAEFLVKDKKQLSFSTADLSILEVYKTFLKIAELQGEKSQSMKIRNLSDLLNKAKPLESRYIIRVVLGKLRLGIGDATILDALSFIATGGKDLRKFIERDYNLCSDLGLVSKLFLENPGSVKNFRIEVFKPLRVALAERASSPDEIIKRMGKCALEYKYDGFRMQIHKKGNKVQIFSRKLERMEHMFPDIVESIKKLKCNEIIFEGEALAYNESKNKFFSFQETMHRRRKYGIESASREYPLSIYAFDILCLDGEDMTTYPFLGRRKILENLFPFDQNLKISHIKRAENVKAVESFFNDSVEKGLEGIMAKDLHAPYNAGKRGFSWLKLKKGYSSAVDTIDGIIVGYYKGKGSRASLGFGGVLLAVYNYDKDSFETIAKIGSGFTEEEMQGIKEMLDKSRIPLAPKNLSTKMDADFWAEPKYVVEVAFDEITVSQQHTCYESENAGKGGLALRFPRFIRLRDDKDVLDATTSQEVFEMFEKMKDKQGRI